MRWGRTLEDSVDFVVMFPKLLIVNFCPQLFYLEWVALSRYSEYIPQSQRHGKFSPNSPADRVQAVTNCNHCHKTHLSHSPSLSPFPPVGFVQSTREGHPQRPGCPGREASPSQRQTALLLQWRRGFV